MQEIIQRLELQVKDLQEGLGDLSRATSLHHLGERFCRMLQGTLLTTNVNLFHWPRHSEEWQPVYLSDKSCLACLKNLSVTDKLYIADLENGGIRMALSMPLTDGGVFGLLIGNKLDRSDFSEFDRLTVQMFLLLLDHSYQSFTNYRKVKELNFQLNHRILQLNSLVNTGIEISKLQESDSLLMLTLERAAALTNASMAELRMPRIKRVVKNICFPESLSREKLDAHVHQISTEFQFHNLLYQLLLYDKETRKGITSFDETDQLMLDAFARQVYAALENQYLHQEALEKERIQKELSVAGDIQKKILPEQLPGIEGYDVAGINIPSKEVGGDYYNCKKLGDGRYAFIMADVAGKGVPASLLVSTLDACLSAYLDMDLPLSDLATKINTIICNASPPDKFITFFMAVLSPESGELDIINAGHNPTLLLKRDRTLYKIEAGGIPLGMIDMGMPFSSETLVMQPQERLLFYTDGVPEAMNHLEEEYSDERLEAFLLQNQPAEAQQFIQLLMEDLKSFTGNTPQSDDITALYLIRK